MPTRRPRYARAVANRPQSTPPSPETDILRPLTAISGVWGSDSGWLTWPEGDDIGSSNVFWDKRAALGSPWGLICPSQGGAHPHNSRTTTPTPTSKPGLALMLKRLIPPIDRLIPIRHGPFGWMRVVLLTV